ncbi:MAG: hypothetical protein ACE5G8_13485 [Anaerolineae bacterium]
MPLDRTQQLKLLWGAAIGALLGAGAAWLLMKAPANLPDGEEPDPISPGEILNLTGAAATLIRRLDDFRRKM